MLGQVKGKAINYIARVTIVLKYMLWKFPRLVTHLKYIETIQTTIHGQGITFDRTVKDKMVMYGIRRDDNLIIAFQIK